MGCAMAAGTCKSGLQLQLLPEKWLLLAASLSLGSLSLLAFLFRARPSLRLPPWCRALLPRAWAVSQLRGEDDDAGGGEGAGGMCERRRKEPVRVFMDGCFDLMHLGHANALRQAKALGDVLVVGVCSEEEMRQNKGPPVLSTDERLAMVRAVKWVDEVIPDTPYCITPEFLDHLFTHHRIDMVVHGDDPCLLPDGSDAYASAKATGRYREIKRTEGVSSTDILARILVCAQVDMTGTGNRGTPDSSRQLTAPSRESAGTAVAAVLSETNVNRKNLKGIVEMELEQGGGPSEAPSQELQTGPSSVEPAASASVPAAAPASATAAHSSSHGQGRTHQFLASARRIVQFCGTPHALTPSMRVVYIDGAFDLFHDGHVAILEDARKLGDYLLVGVHDDAVVRANRGPHYPVMALHERCMAVLSCRHVDDVIFGAPWVVGQDLLTTFNVSLVVKGSVQESNPLAHHERSRLDIPRVQGVLRELQSRRNTTTNSILRRVLASQDAFALRHSKRSWKELAYYSGKKYVVEH